MGRKSPFDHKLVHIWHHAALQQFTLHCLALFCSASQFILHIGVHVAMFGTLHIVHCTVQHSLARPLLGQTVHLPDALKDVAFPAISGDWISLAKFVRMLARAVRLNYRRSFLLICPWQLASVHEARRHVVGSAEEHVGVVSARLRLVGEPVRVVERLQRGVDVVVVAT